MLSISLLAREFERNNQEKLSKIPSKLAIQLSAIDETKKINNSLKNKNIKTSNPPSLVLSRSPRLLCVKNQNENHLISKHTFNGSTTLTWLSSLFLLLHLHRVFLLSTRKCSKSEPKQGWNFLQLRSPARCRSCTVQEFQTKQKRRKNIHKPVLGSPKSSFSCVIL